MSKKLIWAALGGLFVAAIVFGYSYYSKQVQTELLAREMFLKDSINQAARLREKFVKDSLHQQAKLLAQHVSDSVAMQISEEQMRQASEAFSDEVYNKEFAKKNFRKLIKIADVGYQTEGLGGIHNIQVTVANNSEYHIDAALVSVNAYKANGDYYGQKKVIVRNIPAGGRAWERAPDFDRGTRVECVLVQVKSAELGL